MFLAEFVGKPIALDAKPRLQGILRVVDAGVIHPAVARAGSHSQLGKFLDKEYILPALRYGVGDSAANHAAADDQNVGLVHKPILFVCVIHGD
jgi:hypothetical protein